MGSLRPSQSKASHIKKTEHREERVIEIVKQFEFPARRILPRRYNLLDFGILKWPSSAV